MANEKRLRVSFDARNEVLRRAVYIAAAMLNKTHNDVLNDLIEGKIHGLARYIELARKAIEADDPRPRRKPKDEDAADAN